MIVKELKEILKDCQDNDNVIVQNLSFNGLELDYADNFRVIGFEIEPVVNTLVLHI